MKSSLKLTKEQIEPYFLEWSHLSAQINDLFKLRNQAVKGDVQAGIIVYKQLLGHCRSALAEESFEPLNGEERLSFIESSPGTYAAYRQLNELFSELKKIIARKRIEYKHLNK